MPNVTIAQIKELFPEIVSYASDSELSGYIGIAEAQVTADYKVKGYDYDTILNTQDFYLPLSYKVIALVSHGKFKEQGDRHYTRYEDFNKMYLDFIKDLRIKIDEDDDGEAEETAIPFLPFLINQR